MAINNYANYISLRIIPAYILTYAYMIRYSLCLFAVFFSYFSYAQNNTNVFPVPGFVPAGHANHLGGTNISSLGHEVNSDTVTDLHFILMSENFNEGDTTLQKIKESRNKLRREHRDSIIPIPNPMPVIDATRKNAKTTGGPSLFINRNFKGTDDPNWCPNDNSIAISNSGYVISATNSNMTIKDENGKVLKNISLNALLGNSPSFSSALYDPKIIYDNTLDRFFLVCLDGMNPTTSKLIVAFTTASNPLNNWYYYTFNASDVLSSLWIDYPSIGLNSNSLCISGNTFDAGNNPVGNILFKFNKSDLLKKPATATYQYWTNLQDDQGNVAFTLFPVSYGQAGSYGPNMLFVSTQVYGGDQLQFWILNDTTNTIYGKAYATNGYAISADANEPGTTNQLDVGDCRTKGAFYIYNPLTQTGVIYFVFTSITSVSSFNGVVKAKFIIKSSGVTDDAIAFASYTDDYAHPNIASYGGNGGDETVVVSFEACASTTYPYFGVIALDSANANISLLVRSGTNFIYDYDPTKLLCRWGDYSGICRKYNALGAPIIWTAGCYGLADNTGGTWIAELSPSKLAVPAEIAAPVTSKLYPNPSSGFTNLEFKTDADGYCSIDIMSIDGRYNQHLFNNVLPDGAHKISLTTRNLANGNYIIRIVAGGKTIATEKLVVQNSL